MSTSLESNGPLYAPQHTPSAETTGHGCEQRVNLPTDSLTAGTPRYVLLAANSRIGPKMVRSQQVGVCSPIFGFSDKDHYEKFRAESPLSLTPYPLVKRYLQSQIDSSDVALKLVVVDADGPKEPNLHAAKMEDVLEALANGNNAVTARYRLTFDRATDGYTLEDVVT